MKLKTIFKSPWLYFAIIIILSIAFVQYNNINANTIKDSAKYNEFAKYLTKEGAKMYGTSWCSYCKKQKELFGDSFEYINYVDCEKESKLCLDTGVKGFPTWSINGKNYPGLKSLEELAKLTGYKGEIS